MSREQWDLRGQHQLKETKRKASAGSKWGLGENALVAASSLIRVRTVVKCPEFAVRGLMDIASQTVGMPERQRTFPVGRL